MPVYIKCSPQFLPLGLDLKHAIYGRPAASAKDVIRNVLPLMSEFTYH